MVVAILVISHFRYIGAGDSLHTDPLIDAIRLLVIFIMVFIMKLLADFQADVFKRKDF